MNVISADECHGDQCCPICHESSPILLLRDLQCLMHRYVDLSILGYRTIESHIYGVEANSSHGCHCSWWENQALGSYHKVLFTVQKGSMGVEAGHMGVH